MIPSDPYLSALFTAFWLGILTSISPCPLATNIAAISFIGKQVERPWRTFIAGAMYTFGRMITYVGLALLIINSLLSIPTIALFLQRQMNVFMGPLLILTGILLLGVIRIKGFGFTPGMETQHRIAKKGIWGTLLLGIVFALSFCPVSAAFYFGSLIPLSLEQESSVMLPVLYGIGTSLPVVIFAALIASGVKYVGQLFTKISSIEKWARRITAILFILVGCYFVLTYIFKIQIQ